MIPESTWSAFLETDPPRIPLDAFRALLEAAPTDPTVEDRLLAELEKALEDEESLVIFWIVILLGEIRSERAIPFLLECFDDEDGDLLLEAAVHALVRIREPAARAVMVFLDEKRTHTARLYAYGVLEKVPDWASPAFVMEVRDYLMRKVVEEEELPKYDSLFDSVLQDLALFPGGEVREFVYDAVAEYEWHRELEDALDVADGLVDDASGWLGRETWEKICARIMRHFKDDNGFSYFLDPAQEVAKIRPRLKTDDRERAIGELRFLSEKYKNHWHADLLLAEDCMESGKNGEALPLVETALTRMVKGWNDGPYGNRYEPIEKLMQTRDILLHGNGLGQFLRIPDYVVGMLADLGAVEMEALLATIEKTPGLVVGVTREMVEKVLAKDVRLKLVEGVMSLASIKTPSEVIAERRSRGLEPLFRHDLTALKLIQEGRRKTIHGAVERELDWDLRLETRGRIRLEIIRPRLLQEFKGMIGPGAVLRDVAPLQADLQEIQELANAISRAWNYLPRWELGGRSPDEMRTTIPKPTTKVGRNDPCPCGSGRKFKKCCGGTGH